MLLMKFLCVLSNQIIISLPLKHQFMVLFPGILHGNHSNIDGFQKIPRPDFY